MIRATEANLTKVSDKVAALKKKGRSLDEVVAAKPTAAYDAKWGGFLMNPEFFTRLSYAACKRNGAFT